MILINGSQNQRNWLKIGFLNRNNRNLKTLIKIKGYINSKNLLEFNKAQNSRQKASLFSHSSPDSFLSYFCFGKRSALKQSSDCAQLEFIIACQLWGLLRDWRARALRFCCARKCAPINWFSLTMWSLGAHALFPEGLGRIEIGLK